MLLSLLAFLFVSPIGPAGAESRQTLRETEEWLKHQLPQTVVYEHEGEERRHSISVSPTPSCRLSFADTLLAGKKLREIRFSVALADLDPDETHHRIEEVSGAWYLVVPTRFSKPTVDLQMYGGPEGAAMEVQFVFANRAIAKRVSAALSHAITLCGGKPDPFED